MGLAVVKPVLYLFGVAAAVAAGVLAASAVLNRQQRLAHHRALGRGR